MNFLSQLPNGLVELFQSMENEGINFTGVGGSVRDWLLNQKISLDLDFEFRSKTLSLKACNEKIKKILTQNYLTFSQLPYEIIKFSFHSFDIELSPPRIEKSLDQNYSHHHFEAYFDLNMNIKDSFVRRDLTINAIGVDFVFSTLKEVLVDPFNGLGDLNKKVLTNLSDDFYLDPVRLLRLIRFQTNWNFLINENIDKNLKKFNCLELSKYHLKSETLKSKFPAKFLKKVIEIMVNHSIKLNEEIAFIKNLTIHQEDSTLDDLLITNMLADNLVLSSFIDLFHFPQKNVKKIERYLIESKKLNNLNQDYWKAISENRLSNKLKAAELEHLRALNFIIEEKRWQKKIPLKDIYQKIFNEMGKLEINLKVDLSFYDKEVRSLVLLYESIKKVTRD